MRLRQSQKGFDALLALSAEAHQRLALVLRCVDAHHPTGLLHPSHQFGHRGLFGQHDVGQFPDAQVRPARQAGHDAPFHQRHPLRLHQRMKLAGDALAGARQQVGQVLIDKSRVLHVCVASMNAVARIVSRLKRHVWADIV